MRYRTLGFILLPLLGAASVLQADHSRADRFAARLVGTDEVPSISSPIDSPASGEFSLRVNSAGTQLNYTLRYRDLEASVTQAHIHFGDKDVNGGISIWLCSNLASPPTPPNVQACPLESGTVTGTLTSADVVGPAAQGIDAGQLAEVLKAVRNGLAYANVHSTKYPAGEIRGQISRESGRDDD